MNIVKKINIAIDGPSGVGKSTIASMLANELKYLFVNTGSVYRAFAYYLYLKKIDIYNQTLVEKSFVEGIIKLDPNGDVFVQNQKLDHELRSDLISKNTSIIAKYKKVRANVVQILQKFASNNKGIIMDGRDTTFVVMPNAELKIFLWADAEVRAQRRVLQNQKLGYDIDYNTILEEIKKRDYIDMNREINPLHKTEDAILVDSTSLNVQQVFETILNLVKSKVV